MLSHAILVVSQTSRFLPCFGPATAYQASCALPPCRLFILPAPIPVQPLRPSGNFALRTFALLHALTLSPPSSETSFGSHSVRVRGANVL